MRRLGNRIEEAAISGVLAFGYGLHGEFARAIEAARHGIELARQAEHLPTLAACLQFGGVAHGWHGEIDKSVAGFEEALACSEKAGDVFRKYLIYGWRGEAYLLDRSLFRRLSTGEPADPDFLRFAFPTRCHYDVVRGLEHLRATGDPPDSRASEAVDIVRSKRQPDGKWLLDHAWKGATHFPLDDGVGLPSRWNTLRAMRVLRWAGDPVP